LAAGFLGAGLFGLLFGHGMFGGLGGFASIFGLLLQIALVVLVGRLIWVWWQRRNAPAYAGGPMLRGLSPDHGTSGGPAYGGRAGGRVVEGDAAQTGEATELWTFMRSRGASWLLSAIQQT